MEETNSVDNTSDDSQDRDDCWMKLKIVSAGGGIVAGCVSCPLFGFIYGNIDASVWAGLSVLVASMVFQLHLLYK